MNEEEDILRYLNYEMDETERRQFELRIEEDEDLRESVLHSRNIKNILNEDTSRFRSEVHDVIVSNRKSQSFSKIWIAASISILTLAAIYFLLAPQPSTMDLVLAFQEPYPDIITSRTEESIVDMSPYNQRNYMEAIPVFEASLQSDEILLHLYLGISYLMVDKNDEAVEVLSGVSFEQTQFKADFQWYLSLALIKSAQYEDAKTKLKELQRESTYYSDRCKDLLESLN